MDIYETTALILVIVFAIPILVFVAFVIRIVWAVLFEKIEPDEYTKELLTYEDAVKKLTLEEAKTKFERCIADNENYTISRSHDAKKSHENLGSTLNEFFKEYDSVGVLYDDCSFYRADVGSIDIRHGFIWLGKDGEHTHVMSKPNEDKVYIVADDVPMEHQIEDEYPSIYHYLLTVDKRIRLSEISTDNEKGNEAKSATKKKYGNKIAIVFVLFMIGFVLWFVYTWEDRAKYYNAQKVSGWLKYEIDKQFDSNLSVVPNKPELGQLLVSGYVDNELSLKALKDLVDKHSDYLNPVILEVKVFERKGNHPDRETTRKK